MVRLLKVNGAYFYRRRVPSDIRFRVGKEFVKRSLGTRDESVARDPFPAIAAEFDAWFEEIRRGVLELTPEEAEAIAGEIYALMIDQGRNHRFVGMPHALFRNITLEQCRMGQKQEIECEGGGVI